MKIATLFPHTALYIFGQKFRESNVFTIGYTKELNRRKFSWVTVNFPFFHTVQFQKKLFNLFFTNFSVKSNLRKVTKLDFTIFP